MKILDVGEPIACSDLMYEIYVIVDKALPCLSDPEGKNLRVRNPNTVGLDYHNMAPVAVLEVTGNMLRLYSWSFFKICPGQLLEPDVPEVQLFSKHLQHEIARSVCSS